MKDSGDMEYHCCLWIRLQEGGCSACAASCHVATAFVCTVDSHASQQYMTAVTAPLEAPFALWFYLSCVSTLHE